MSEMLSQVNPLFFGRDKYTPFVGCVEDVNDPKASGRVKVRCVGWHPKEKEGKDSLPTEDLPWAHVAMPCTYAQQGRVGGKHGLLPGSWVIGFFFDGEDAQQPIVTCSFNFTANASPEDNRQELKGTGGTVDKVDLAFGKVNPTPEFHNIAARITAEEGLGAKGFGASMDVAGDAFTMSMNLMGDEEPCGTLESKSSELTTKTPFSNGAKGNPESQIYNVLFGDGLCGSIMHAKDDMQRKMMEQIPPSVSRFVFNDSVWNAITGNYIDLNGLLMGLAQDLCNLLKQPILSAKAEVEDKVNRTTKSTTLAIPDRDGMMSIILDEITTLKDDLFHGIFSQSFIDILCKLLLGMLQQLNSGGGQGQGNNYTGNIGATPGTDIQNWGAECMTNAVLDTVNVLTSIAIKNTQEQVSKSESDGSMSSIGASILASIVGGMGFPLIQKYSTLTNVFNKAGSMSQDLLTKNLGCLDFRSFNTMRGMTAYKSAVDSNYKNVGFGGRKGAGDTSGVPTACEDAKNPPDDLNANGSRAVAVAIALPSSLPEAGSNFINGIPNTIIILEPGNNYFYKNNQVPDEAYPSIYIPGYRDNPIPVVDSDSGEMVAIITDVTKFDRNKPNPPVSIIPDKNPGNGGLSITGGTGGYTGQGGGQGGGGGDTDGTGLQGPQGGKNSGGIRTDDDNYDIVIGGIHINNMGFGYCNPQIELYDKDKKINVGEVKATVLEGHIVNVEVIDNGTGFRRIPEIRITDNGKECGTKGGYGAELYPIMSVVPRPSAKPTLPPIEVIQCPSKNQTNIYSASGLLNNQT